MDNNQIFNQPTNPIINVSEATVATVNYAGFWKRFLACFIDGVFLGLLGFGAGFIIGTDLIITFSFNIFVGLIYFGVFDSSIMMGSPGKALVGIAIVTEETHQRISFKKAVVRYLLKNLSWVVLAVGYLMQVFTKKRQTLHDMISEVVVIQKDVGDINYFKAYKENFKQILD